MQGPPLTAALSPPAALIFAAGRGERMRPLTDHTPKPLLPVRGQPLMQWTLAALLRGGVRQVVINTAWLGQQIEDYFGDSRWRETERAKRLRSKPDQRTRGQGFPDQWVRPPLGDGASAPQGERHFNLCFSREGADFGHALETAGGIARALPWLAADSHDVFWAVAGDIYAPDFVFSHAAATRFAAGDALAHLWLVPRLPDNPAQVLGLSANGLVLNAPAPGGAPHTFSAYALYRRALFEPPWCDIPPGNPQGIAMPLVTPLRRAISAGRVSAELYTGAWADIGTPERLAQVNAGNPVAPE